MSRIDWSDAFYRWLAARLAEIDVEAARQPVDSAVTVAPRADGHLVAGPDGTRNVGRQSNLAARPGQRVTFLGGASARALGDGTRFRAPFEPRPSGVGVPRFYYPLDPPTPPRGPALVDTFYHPPSGIFRWYADPLDQGRRVYGEAAPAPSYNEWSLMNTRGISLGIAFGGQIIDGVRSYFGLEKPHLRVSTYGPGTGVAGVGRSYLNLEGTSFEGLPQPYFDGVPACFATYDSGVITASQSLLDEAVGNVYQYDEDGGRTSAAFKATVPTKRVNYTSGAVAAYLTLRFRWLAAYNGAPTGQMRGYWIYEWVDHDRDGYEVWAASDTSLFPEFTGAEVPVAGHERARLLGLYPAFESNMQYEDWSLDDCPRPSHGTYGSVITTGYEDGDGDAYEDEFYYERVYASGVWGHQIAHADFQADTGSVIPQWSTQFGGLSASDDAIQGIYSFAVPVESFARAYRVPDFSAAAYQDDYALTLAENVPVMFQNENGTIPRPLATHAGTWCGIPYAAVGTPGSVRLVCCDALIADGVLWGVVLESDEIGGASGTEVLTISRNGEVVHTGKMADLVAPEYVAEGLNREAYSDTTAKAYPHQRWQLPSWPHRQAALRVGGDWVYVRPKFPYERWVKAPLAAVTE